MTAKRSQMHWLWLALAVLAIPVVVLAAPNPSTCPACYSGQCDPNLNTCGSCPAYYQYQNTSKNVLCTCCDTTSLACGAVYWWYKPANTNYQGTAYAYKLVQTGPPPSSCVAGVYCLACWSYIYNGGSTGGCC
jgi:LSD1 subclass zinc finger protein